MNILSTNKKRLTVLFLFALFVIVGVCLVYFFVWRSSDDGYNAANGQLTTIRTTTNEVTAVIAPIHTSADIEDSSVFELKETVTQFDSHLKTLSENAVITKDQAVKKAYDQYKDSFTNYGKSVSDLAASMEKYRIILLTCTSLVDKLGTISTTTAFDTAANGCGVAIENAQSTPDTSFKDQFLSKYAILASDLLTAYKQQIKAGTDKAAQKTASDLVTSIKQKISTLGKQEFNLTLDSPTENLQKLQDVVNAQKSAFFR